MPKSFLLRFQEDVVESDGNPATCGTQTATRVRGEQPDPDVGEALIVAVPRTGTRIGAQSSAKDLVGGAESDVAGSNEIRLKKWSAGTRTVTAVRAEVDDNDPGKTSMRMVPRCSSS